MKKAESSSVKVSTLNKLHKHRFWIDPLAWSTVMLGIMIGLILTDWLGVGSGMKFENPWFLLGLLAVPLIIAQGVFERQTSGNLRFPLARLIAVAGPGWRTRLLPVVTGLRCTAVALLVIALARPQDSTRQQETELDGIDIVMTLDVSGSMKASDLQPTRLDAAKHVMLDFIKRRKNDRIGAVIFATNAYTLCPLTLDYSILANMISDLKLGVIDNNKTAIGNAVGVSLNRLRKSDAKSRTIILLTDGTSNAGNISPEQAALFAKTLGVKIYTILVGQRDDAKQATGVDFFKNQIFGATSSPINPALLRQMSEQTGGAFFEATDVKALISSFHEILDELERSKIADRGVVYAEVFGKYLWPALILIVLELLASLVILRRTP